MHTNHTYPYLIPLTNLLFVTLCLFTKKQKQFYKEKGPQGHVSPSERGKEYVLNTIDSF